jgi:hypothetical protein
MHAYCFADNIIQCSFEAILWYFVLIKIIFLFCSHLKSGIADVRLDVNVLRGIFVALKSLAEHVSKYSFSRFIFISLLFDEQSLSLHPLLDK